MNIFAVILIAYFALNALMSVARVGKPSAALTPGAAVVVIVIYAALIMCVLQAVAS